MTELTARKKALFALLVFGCAVFAALVLTEIYVRVSSPYGYVTPDTLRAMTPDYEPAVFARSRIRRGAKTVTVGGEEQFRINAHGYRGRDFSVKKPEGAIRIMFYGGSSVFNAESTNDNDWPHRVERLLRGNGFSNVEVINAGIPGYASIDAVGAFFTEGHTFSPDYVLLYDQWNDIKYFRSTEPLLREFNPGDSDGDPRTTYQNVLDRVLSNVSQLYVRLRERYYTWKLNVGEEGLKPVGEYSSTVPDAGLRQYRLNIEMFVDIARNIGAVPILMVEARLVAPDNSSKERSRIHYDFVLLTHDALCEVFARQDEIIYDVASKKNIRVIDASKKLTGRDELFANHIHLNDQGSQELATLVAAELAEVLRAREVAAR